MPEPGCLLSATSFLTSAAERFFSTTPLIAYLKLRSTLGLLPSADAIAPRCCCCCASSCCTYAWTVALCESRCWRPSAPVALNTPAGRDSPPPDPEPEKYVGTDSSEKR